MPQCLAAPLLRHGSRQAGTSCINLDACSPISSSTFSPDSSGCGIAKGYALASLHVTTEAPLCKVLFCTSQSLTRIMAHPDAVQATLPLNTYLSKVALVFAVFFAFIGAPIANQTFDPNKQVCAEAPWEVCSALGGPNAPQSKTSGSSLRVVRLAEGICIQIHAIIIQTCALCPLPFSSLLWKSRLYSTAAALALFTRLPPLCLPIPVLTATLPAPCSHWSSC